MTSKMTGKLVPLSVVIVVNTAVGLDFDNNWYDIVEDLVCATAQLDYSKVRNFVVLVHEWRRYSSQRSGVNTC